MVEYFNSRQQIVKKGDVVIFEPDQRRKKMKHNYITCDCCGKIINTNGHMTYYKIKRGLRFGPWCSIYGDHVDILLLQRMLLCQNCWDDIHEYVKEKRNDR